MKDEERADFALKVIEAVIDQYNEWKTEAKAEKEEIEKTIIPESIPVKQLEEPEEQPDEGVFIPSSSF